VNALEKLKSNPLLQTLTPPERTFVIAYCEQGRDKISAGKIAWPTATEASIRTLSNRTIDKEVAGTLIDSFFLETEQPTLDEMRALLWRLAKTSDDDAVRLKAMDQIANMSGWKTKPAAPEAAPAGAQKSIYDQAEEIRSKN
jgi:hypothetical protein